MKRTLALIAVFVLLLTGCGTNVPADIVGDWSCRDVASDNQTQTDFYHLWISENGEFSMYDAAAGNPGIEGKLTSPEEGKLALKCTSEDFDPPYCWDMSEKATLDYKVDGDTISLGYEGVWITFDKSKE